MAKKRGGQLFYKQSFFQNLIVMGLLGVIVLWVLSQYVFKVKEHIYCKPGSKPGPGVVCDPVVAAAPASTAMPAGAPSAASVPAQQAKPQK
jgi:hypothetical protein